MSFDNYMGKEKRKPYRRSKAFDRGCRNHGSCPWCERSRRIQEFREKQRIQDELDNWHEVVVE